MPAKISEAVENLLKGVAAATGKPITDVEKEFDEEYKNVQTWMQGASQEDLLKATYSRMSALYRKMMTPNARSEQFTGMFLGMSGVRDNVAKKRKAALDLYKVNKDEAIKRHIVYVEDDTVLPLWIASQEEFIKMQDWQRNQRFIKDEFGYLTDKDENKWSAKPMPDHDYQRTVYGAVIKEVNGNKHIIKTEFRIRGENTRIMVPLYCWVKFNAINTQASNEDYLRLSDIKNMMLTPLGGIAEDSEVKKIFETAFQQDVINISQLDTFCEKHQGEFAPLAVLNVTVVEVVPVTEGKTQVMTIQDDSIPSFGLDGKPVPATTCWINKDYKINFPERSDVMVIGSPMKNIEKGTITISVYGIFAPKIHRNNMPPIKPITDVNEQIVNEVGGDIEF